MVSSERSNSDLSEYTLFQISKKFSDFVNSDDPIGKITSKSIRLHPVFIQKKILSLEKTDFFLVKKMRNSGICIYDYAHSFFGEDFLIQCAVLI